MGNPAFICLECLFVSFAGISFWFFVREKESAVSKFLQFFEMKLFEDSSWGEMVDSALPKA